ncbi:hypothetical protein [Kutzneria sp. 744]|uniref:hypothetical protein n=1 Tax=Kutzneria sp. (strain 744) TaxID=345341 RepID=UPI0003EEA931|nr:hypothetical protein [Kutzneria sp. 744]EWM14208.1 collagen alpha-2(I) chain [Kutzneria sp. 744]
MTTDATRLLERTRLDARRATRRFVEPTGFLDALAKLLSSRAVVLAGPPGSGRRTAATVLLDRLGGLHLVEIAVDDEATLARHPVAAKEGYLLDLTSADDATVDQVKAALAEFTATLDQEDSSLVVIVDDDRAAGFEAIKLPAPEPGEVLKAHLAGAEFNAVPGKPPATSAEAVRLAELLLSVEDPRLVAAAYNRWKGRLRKQFDQHEEVPWRALLLAAAFLEGAHQDVVDAAAEALLAETRYEGPKPHPLAGPGLAARLAGIGAFAGTVTFSTPGYADAVIDYVWSEFPTLREPLVDWLIGLPANLPGEDCARLAARVIGLGAPAVVKVVTAWAETAIPLARGLLAAAVLDPVIGPDMRRVIKDWSRRRDLPRALSEVAIAVCGGELGSRFPHIALTRLGSFVTRPELTDQVASALSTMAGESQFAQVVTRLARWLRETDEARRALAVRALLDEAAAQPQHRETLLNLLVQAAGGRPSELGALDLAAFEWRRDGGSRDVHDQLQTKLNGVDPLLRSAISS